MSLQTPLQTTSNHFLQPPASRISLGAGGRGASRIKICRPLPTEGWRGVLNFKASSWPKSSFPRAHRSAAGSHRSAAGSPGFTEFSFFVAFNFDFEFLLFFTPLPNLPKPPKIAQKTSKNLPKTPPKPLPNRISSCNARNLKKIRPSHTKPSFLTFPGLRKSLQNRYQNAFRIDSLLDALLESPKLRIWMLKRRQDGPLIFHYFYLNPLKIVTIPVFGP